MSGLALVAGFMALLACHAAGRDAALPPAVFTSTIAQVSALPDSVGVPVEWHFTNSGDLPLAVEQFIESCGCLSGNMAAQATEPVAPGQSGVIRASFTPGQHRGLLRKTLHVRFVGYENPVELVVEAHIRATVRLSRQELTWTSTESSKSSVTEIIDVITDTDTPFAITGLLGVPESQFIIVQQTITPDKHYQLHITPVASRPATSVSAALQLRTNSPDPRDQVLVLLLNQWAIP